MLDLRVEQVRQAACILKFTISIYIECFYNAFSADTYTGNLHACTRWGKVTADYNVKNEQNEL